MLTDDDVERLQKVIVEPLEKRMVSVEVKIDKNTERLGAVEDRLGSVENRLEVVEDRLEVVEDKVDGLRTDVNAIHVIISSDKEELGRRIQKLEKHSGITP